MRLPLYMAMTLHRSLKWIAAALLTPVVLAALFIAFFGWNWLRGPIERMTTEKTGRLLVINGDLKVKFGWPLPRMRAEQVTFANPVWTREKQMVSADAVEISIDLPQLMRRNIVLPEVALERPVVFLEQGSGGRKNWLLDLDQQDEDARIRINRLTLDTGQLGYDNAGQNTSLRSELSMSNARPGTPNGAGITFTAKGKYKGLALKAAGNGDPVLALRDESAPYALKVDATIGNTRIKADGTVTSLLKFSAIDMRLALSGDTLEQLFPLLGITFPATRAYVTEGHLLHGASTWRYEKFSGRIGASDIAGWLQVDTGGKRPAMKAELVSRLLDIADLGPLIGAKPGAIQAAKQAPPSDARVLPDMPFNTANWNSVDAEVTLNAKSIRHARELPLENLVTHLSLRDAVLKLDPLNFGLAGGQMNGTISLDGRKNPIQAHAQVRARKILLGKLFPAVELSQTSIGQINGEFALTGTGNSVGRMLATANGKAGLVVVGGEISKLMMEKAGLHLWEMLALSVTGDRLVKLRCGVADFDIKTGTMNAEALIFDTAITTIVGTGTIDLAQEQLAITLNQKTKNTSPLALRSPIHIRGSFAAPDVQVAKGPMIARGVGAIALGLINPFLALIPLIDLGPGKDSDCAQLVRDARAMPHSNSRQTGTR